MTVGMDGRNRESLLGNQRVDRFDVGKTREIGIVGIYDHSVFRCERRNMGIVS